MKKLCLTLGFTGLLMHAALIASSWADLSSPVNQSALDAIFSNGLPAPYEATSSQALNTTSNEAVGFYAFLENPKTQSQVILIDIRQADQRSFYLTEDLGRLAKTLLTQAGPTMPIASPLSVPISLKIQPLRSNAAENQLANLKIAQPKGVDQLGFIGRLKFSQDRHIVLLLLNAHYPEVLLATENTPLRLEANTLIDTLRNTDKTLPSERFILWRLRRIFK
ncbi:hypothetical protein [Vampirovibrio sp.]|uniref:hypothetical protein n=1 Tax=Vampirovibrio sp. TaxID=2717857 RepID=UPI0035931A9B